MRGAGAPRSTPLLSYLSLPGMNYLRQHPSITAVLINMVLFGLVFACCFPIFNSGDDAYLLYLLGGGFGNAPTELLHYQHGMHPLLGWLVKTAFVQYPDFNWYSLFLYSFHFVACCVILSRSIKKNELAAGLAYYCLFFIPELFFLLQPSFTNTALVTAVSGMLMVYTSLQQKQNDAGRWLGFGLLLAAALLRLHMLIPVILLALPFVIITINRTQLWRLIVPVITLSVLITLAFVAQRQYYIKNIPGWKQEEAYRQTIINHYNIPKKASVELKGEPGMRANFLERGILWDTIFLSQQQVAATTTASRLSTAARQRDFRQRLFWLMIESRMGLLLMLFAFLLKNASLSRAEKTAALSGVAVFVVLCAALILFRKLPGYIVTGGMLQWIAFVNSSGSLRPRAGANRPILIGAAMVIVIWGIIRINKLNQSNTGHYDYWRCAYAEVSLLKNNLLLVTDDQFPVDYFSVWDAPSKYPLLNVLTKDHFLNKTYQPAFKRSGIQSLNSPEQLLFIGNPSIMLEEYYEKKNGRNYEARPAAQPTSCLKIWGLY